MANRRALLSLLCSPAKELWLAAQLHTASFDLAQGSGAFADTAWGCRDPTLIMSGANAGGKFPLPELESRRISDMHEFG